MKTIDMIVAEVTTGVTDQLVKMSGHDVAKYRTIAAQVITDPTTSKMLVESILCRIAHNASLSDIMTALSAFGLPDDPRSHMHRLQAAIERVGEALQRDAALMTPRTGDATRPEDASNG